MVSTLRLALWFLLASTTAAASSSADNQQSSSSSTTSTSSGSTAGHQQCGLYVAPSSKSTTADFKWGLYAADALPPGTLIGTPALAVPVHQWRAQHLFAHLPPDERDYWFHLAQHVSNYLWPSEIAGAQSEYDDDTPEDPTEESDPSNALGMAIPGPRFLANFAGAPRSNADWDRAEAHRRTPSFVDEAGRSHPNRGAISPWNRVTLRTTKPISAGSEIVVHYDDPLLAGQSSSSSADDDNENDADEHAVTSEDYRKIDETIQQMLQFFDKHAANLDDGARDQIYRFLVQDFMEAAVGPIKARRVAELFPPGPQELVHVPLAGGIKNYSNDTSRVQLRRVEWLQSSGYCYDHLIPAPSTVPDAGLGGFATRRISKGSVVVPVPLVHIADEKALDLYDL